jgi:hypothetical protein
VVYRIRASGRKFDYATRIRLKFKRETKKFDDAL